MVFRAVVFTFLPTAMELVLVCALLWKAFRRVHDVPSRRSFVSLRPPLAAFDPDAPRRISTPPHLTPFNSAPTSSLRFARTLLTVVAQLARRRRGAVHVYPLRRVDRAHDGRERGVT
eukprot:10302-Pelagococcus_subviridis.AAC.1